MLWLEIVKHAYLIDFCVFLSSKRMLNSSSHVTDAGPIAVLLHNLLWNLFCLYMFYNIYRK